MIGMSFLIRKTFFFNENETCFIADEESQGLGRERESYRLFGLRGPRHSRTATISDKKSYASVVFFSSSSCWELRKFLEYDAPLPLLCLLPSVNHRLCSRVCAVETPSAKTASGPPAVPCAEVSCSPWQHLGRVIYLRKAVRLSTPLEPPNPSLY